jgi:hypothetical protein
LEFSDLILGRNRSRLSTTQIIVFIRLQPCSAVENSTYGSQPHLGYIQTHLEELTLVTHLFVRTSRS